MCINLEFLTFSLFGQIRNLGAPLVLDKKESILDWRRVFGDTLAGTLFGLEFAWDLDRFL